MIVTSERVLFAPLELSGSRRAVMRLIAFLGHLYLNPLPTYGNHGHVTQGEWASVKRLWKWQPEFSGAPMIQMANDVTWHFQLLRAYWPVMRIASVDDQRAHFDVLEAAWDAARHREAK